MNSEIMNLSNNFKKYNLGCGTHIYNDFLNVGFWEHLAHGSLYKDINGTVNTFMLNHDLRNGIPANNDSLELVYHSHMLEHLSYVDGMNFLKECYRVMQPGSKMRILVPDLELWINAYTSDNKFFFNEYRKILDNDIYVTNGSIFMGMLHNHDHKCGYDYESLKWILEFIGFNNIVRTLYADGSISNIKDLEPQIPLRIMETLCLECEKPL
jgi:SAM-dependent methyltransferase